MKLLSHFGDIGFEQVSICFDREDAAGCCKQSTELVTYECFSTVGET